MRQEKIKRFERLLMDVTFEFMAHAYIILPSVTTPGTPPGKVGVSIYVQSLMLGEHQYPLLPVIKR